MISWSVLPAALGMCRKMRGAGETRARARGEGVWARLDSISRRRAGVASGEIMGSQRIEEDRWVGCGIEGQGDRKVVAPPVWSVANAPNVGQKPEATMSGRLPGIEGCGDERVPDLA